MSYSKFLQPRPYPGQPENTPNPAAPRVYNLISLDNPGGNFVLPLPTLARPPENNTGGANNSYDPPEPRKRINARPRNNIYMSGTGPGTGRTAIRTGTISRDGTTSPLSPMGSATGPLSLSRPSSLPDPKDPKDPSSKSSTTVDLESDTSNNNSQQDHASRSQQPADPNGIYPPGRKGRRDARPRNALYLPGTGPGTGRTGIRTGIVNRDGTTSPLSPMGSATGPLSPPRPSSLPPKPPAPPTAPGVPKIPARAMGGPVRAGRPYLVGEQGPEVIIPKQSGTVVPNHALSYQPLNKAPAQSPSPAGGYTAEPASADDEPVRTPAYDASFDEPHDAGDDTEPSTDTTPAPADRPTTGLLMRPRPMPPEYVQQQQQARSGKPSAYSRSAEQADTDAPPANPSSPDSASQYNDPPQTNLPLATPADTPPATASRLFERRNPPGIPATSTMQAQRGSGTIAADSPNAAQQRIGGQALAAPQPPAQRDYSGPTINAVNTQQKSRPDAGNTDKIPGELEYALKFIAGTLLDGPLNTAVAVFGGPGKYSYNPNPVRRAWGVDGILPKVDRETYNGWQDGAEMLTFALAGATNPKNRVQFSIPAPKWGNQDKWGNTDGPPLSAEEARRWFKEYHSNIAKTGSGEFQVGIEDNVVRSKLNRGTLSFRIARETDDGMQSGKDMFKSMMKFYGPAVKAIQGNWLGGDNLAKVNELTKGGTPLESAIKMTWTGLRADEHGFSVAEINYCGGKPGHYTEIQVTFRKPPAQ